MSCRCCPSSCSAAAAPGRTPDRTLSQLLRRPGGGLDVGGTGTLTVSSGGSTKVIHVSGAPDIYPVAAEHPAQPVRSGTVTIKLSPGLQAYSFTFG